MKKFAFPLDRVLAWRNAQVRIEQMKLERLYSEARALDSRERALSDEADSALAVADLAAGITGQELAAADRFRRYVATETDRIAAARAQCLKRIQDQIAVIASKRRDAKLLENLRERRMRTWAGKLAQETDRHAEEMFLAKWNR